MVTTERRRVPDTRTGTRVRAGMAAVTVRESQVFDGGALGLRGATRQRGGGKWRAARVADENSVVDWILWSGRS
jgi:hypothetical protein